MNIIDVLAEPLGYGFILRGIAAVVLVGAVSAAVGTFIVVRGMAFFGDALAHAILPGIAAGYVLGGGEQSYLLWGGLVAAIVASLTIGAVTESGRVKEDTAIGIIFAGMFALGIAMISRESSYAVDLSHILFGNVLGVSQSDLLIIAVMSFAVLATIFLFYKEFVLISFDVVEARALRLPVRLLHYLLMVLIAVTIVVSLQSVGVALYGGHADHSGGDGPASDQAALAHDAPRRRHRCAKRRSRPVRLVLFQSGFGCGDRVGGHRFVRHHLRPGASPSAGLARPPRPTGGSRLTWLMRMSWHNLAFLHWPVDAATLEARLPPSLTLDLYEGRAWLGVVPFRMVDVGPRGLPTFGPWSEFLELNVRTYVRVDDKPGVFFFSLDAESRVAVRMARRLFHLPYFDADMQCVESSTIGGSSFDYSSQRTHAGAPPGEFRARYWPTGGVYSTGAGSLDEFLTERYCLYAIDGRGRVWRSDIRHDRWPLQPAAVEIETTDVGRLAGCPVDSPPPIVHYSERVDVMAWAPRRA